MLNLLSTQIAATLTSELGRHDARQRLLDMLPGEVAEQLRKDDLARGQARAEHLKALELAEAGRARNFWGK